MLWDMTPTQTSCTIKTGKIPQQYHICSDLVSCSVPSTRWSCPMFLRLLAEYTQHGLFQSSHAICSPSLIWYLCSSFVGRFSPSPGSPQKQYAQPVSSVWPPIQHLDVPIWYRESSIEQQSNHSTHSPHWGSSPRPHTSERICGFHCIRSPPQNW